MPSYKLLTDAFLNGKIEKRGSVVELSEDAATPFVERGTLGDVDTEIDERSSFQKAQDEGTEDSRLVEETLRRDAEAQAAAAAELQQRADEKSVQTVEVASTPDPLVNTPADSVSEVTPVEVRVNPTPTQPTPEQITETLSVLAADSQTPSTDSPAN